MKIKLKNTPEQSELIRHLGAKESSVSLPASEAFAAFLATVIQKVIQQAGTAGVIFTDAPFDEDDNPSYPLDLYYGDDAGLIQIWTQAMAGGIPYNQTESSKELRIQTYRLDTALAIAKKWARKARLDVISKTIERMANEVLIKQERNAWAVVLKALAEANTKINGTYTRHITQSNADDVFIVEDLNQLIVRGRRLNQSYANGTPANEFSKGLTDLFVSPEIKAQVRAFAYQPMNTRSGKVDTSGATSIALPDDVRSNIFNSAGANEIYGINITDLIELGTSQKYNVLFSNFAGGTTYGGASFNSTNDELLIGFDLSKEAFIRPVSTKSDSGGTFTMLPDDQFVSRQDKVGWYGFLEEGRVCIDARAVLGIIV
jgi:hypothetical protein